MSGVPRNSLDITLGRGWARHARAFYTDPTRLRFGVSLLYMLEVTDSAISPERLRAIVSHAAHLLPMQGPIGVFIHHNTLHAFQHMPFEEAVSSAAELFGTEPYMREEQFKAQIRKGRILPDDIEAVLQREPDAEILPGRLTRRRLRYLMLIPGLRVFDPTTISWELHEGNLLRQFRDVLDMRSKVHSTSAKGDGKEVRELFSICFEKTPYPQEKSRPRTNRLQQRILEATGVDIHSVVHPQLIRLTAAFLDQGMAYWPIPERELGFYHTVRLLWSLPGAIAPEYLGGVDHEWKTQLEKNMTPEEVVEEALRRFGIPAAEAEAFITSELLAFPGWAGLVSRLEQEPELMAHERFPCALMDFLAVRLTLMYVAARNIAGNSQAVFSFWSEASTSKVLPSERLVDAAQLFDVAQMIGLSTADIASLPEEHLDRLKIEIQTFHEIERRRVLHLAYELRHERSILGPIEWFRRSHPPTPPASRPSAQVFFCIDEREESTRRHLEEIAPEIETLSAAGFFGVAVDYASIDDAHGVALCPVVVKPQHAVRERPVSEHRHLHASRRARRALWAKVARGSYVSSRTLVRGALSTIVLGTLSLFPLIVRVLSPRRYALLMHALNRWILPEPRTELTLMRTDSEGHNIAENLLLGFSIKEKIDRVASVLGPAGLYERFAPLVVILGHGSTSLNNPHESAHDCGACGGRRGGPNARLFAAMCNHPEVRSGLRERGIFIPDDTWFVGGYHDTCSDEIEYFDLEVMPSSFEDHLHDVQASLDKARELDAHERARRFEAAGKNITPSEALWHVQERSEHLAEPRPEYGHCTNAVCIVGRRAVTRGLFFDRRAFLVSYDPTLDPTDENLARLLGAAIPVCAGISLEYYFSFVDNEGYGCGTKLPHNVTGLVGVMNGHASDLRTGLPWQMVEIHEPVRILFVIETTPERLNRALGTSALLKELVQNRWIRLSTLDPDTGQVHVYRNGHFEPSGAPCNGLPAVSTSVDWYRNKIEHLPVAMITRTYEPLERLTA